MWSIVTFHLRFMVVVTDYRSLDLRGDFPNLFFRTLVRDLCYATSRGGWVCATPPQLPSALLSVYLEMQLAASSVISENCRYVTVNSAVFCDINVGVFPPRSLETSSHERKLFSY